MNGSRCTLCWETLAGILAEIPMPCGQWRITKHYSATFSFGQIRKWFWPMVCDLQDPCSGCLAHVSSALAICNAA